MKLPLRWAVLASFFASLQLFPGGGLRAEPEHWRRHGWARTDFTRSKVTWSEIQSGGPAKDGIPAIDAPRFIAASDERSLAPNEPVIGLEIAGDARAYPLRVLIWHEIVNDTVGGRPVTVTYCPLCNSSIVFDRRLGGRVLDFGTTGKLRNSDLVMYDRQTESWWQQFTGEAIVGELLGAELKLVPARLEAFADFKARHPGGKVLVPNDPGARAYGKNPYRGYDTAAGPLLFTGPLPKGIPAMARVVVVRRAGRAPLIVAMDHVRKSTPVTIDGVELSWKAGQASAVDRGDIAAGRDVGTVLVQSVGGGTNEALAYDVTFAFVAHAFHPDIAIVQR